MPVKEFVGPNAAEEAFAWWRSEEGERASVTCFASGPDKNGGKQIFFLYDTQEPSAVQIPKADEPPRSSRSATHHEIYGHKPEASCTYDIPPAAK